MFLRLLTAAAIAVAAWSLPSDADAATVKVTGGLTTLDVTADLGSLGLSAFAFGTASFDGSTFSFPITGGDDASGALQIEHDGVGVVLAGGTKSATVGNFIIDLGLGQILGNVNGGTAFAPLFDLAAGPTSDTVAVNISATLAGALTSIFSAPNLTGAEFGIASTNPDLAPVPLPAAMPLLLAGLGGLVLLRRRRQTA
ncbi:MAG: VPLPA-CTERM sorting domain-containing protein [Pseudomonadota bacterium]